MRSEWSVAVRGPFAIHVMNIHTSYWIQTFRLWQCCQLVRRKAFRGSPKSLRLGGTRLANHPQPLAGRGALLGCGTRA